MVLALEVVGCNRLRPAQWPELRFEDAPRQLRVVPRQSADAADLKPADIVRVLRRVGFSDEQILELGTDLHTALRSSGAAEIVNGKDAEVTFAVNNEYLFVRSRLQGSFIYDIADSRFGLLPSLSSQPTR